MNTAHCPGSEVTGGSMWPWGGYTSWGTGVAFLQLTPAKPQRLSGRIRMEQEELGLPSGCERGMGQLPGSGQCQQHPLCQAQGLEAAESARCPKGVGSNLPRDPLPPYC